MLLYTIIIIINMILIIILNAAFSPLSWGYSALSTIVLTATMLVVDAIVALIIFILPKKIFNPFSNFYKVQTFERKFYYRIGIKKWKDLIPIGKGPIGIGVAKNKIKHADDNNYLLMFLRDNCMAEMIHLITLPISFVLFVISPQQILWSIALPVVIVNIFLHTLPICVQRYNRPKLIALYNRNMKYNTLEE